MNRVGTFTFIIYDHLYSQRKASLGKAKRTKPVITTASGNTVSTNTATVYWLCFLRCRISGTGTGCCSTVNRGSRRCVTSAYPQCGHTCLSVCLSVCVGRTVTVLIALEMNLQAGRWHFGRVSKRLRFCGFPREMKSRFTTYFEMSRNLRATIEPFRFDGCIS